MQTQTPIEALMESNPAMVLKDLPEDFDKTSQNFFQVMDRKAGDYKVIWNRGNPTEVKQARKNFEDLKKEGYTAYAVNDNGDQGEKVTTFDPNAERLIMVPPVKPG